MPGDRIPPSGGYRLILQPLEIETRTIARCLDLYYKPDQSDITTAEGLKLIAGASSEEPDS